MDLQKHKTGHIFAKYFSILDMYPKFWLSLVVIICLILSSGLIFLTENNDGRVFFDTHSPERQKLKSLEQSFAETNSILLVLSQEKGDIFTERSLEAVLEITDLAWQIPYVTRVNSLSNYQYISSLDDDLVISDLITEDMIRDINQLADIKKYALSESDLVGQILSENAETTAVVLNVAAPRGDSNVIRSIMSEVETIKQRITEKYDGISLYITGDIPLDNAFSEAYSYDLQYLFPFFLLVVFLICYFFFRSFGLSFLILLMMIMVVSVTMGCSGYLGIDLTAGTSGVPIILITIALADFIHLINAMRREVRAGSDETHAIKVAIKNNFLPISLTSLTTFIGFLSLNFSDAPPFRDLGNLVAIGIVISYLITFIFFPIILTKMDISDIFRKEIRNLSLSPEGIDFFSNLLVRRHKIVIAFTILISIFICVGLTKIEFDDDWVKYFDPQNNFRKDTEYVVDHLTGVDTIEYIVSSGKEGGITDPNFLNKLEEFRLWSLEQKDIIHVSSILSLFKKMNFHMMATSDKMQQGQSGAGNTIANDPDLNAQYLLMYEMSLPVGLDLNDRINIGKEATRITITAKDLTSRQLRDLDVLVSNKLIDMDIMDKNDSGTGIPLMFANLSERNIKSMLTGIAFALFVVSFVIVISFKSLKLGVISFFVNIMPIILGFGVWGWLYQYVGVSLTVVAAIAFGIVVDDTIHFISKYNKASSQKNITLQDTLKLTFTEVGGALVMTTIILSMGFTVLSFSLFQPTWGLGLISVIMIVIALLYDLIFLPSILIMFNIILNKK